MTGLGFSDISEYVNVMLKALGVSFISHVCASLCRELGRPTLADFAELAGKLELLLLCIPLASRIIEYAAELI